MADRLTGKEIKVALGKLKGWIHAKNEIHKNYNLKDFAAALAFINRVGEKAEAADHHPDILLHGWNNVEITLSTHSAGGLTENDFKLAKQIDSVVKK